MPSGTKSPSVCQFRVTLREIEPAVWRQVQVPASYSFWDLHVAIQDAMGWLDCHLHAFVTGAGDGSGGTEIGIPNPDAFEGEPVAKPGWKVGISTVFRKPGDTALYRYDFGDGWEHDVLLEGTLPGEPGVKYPRCIAGARACPPEDCGGTPGYEHLVKVIGNPKHREYEQMKSWLENHAADYWPYDPTKFCPASVKFSDPKKRWRQAFGPDSLI